VFLQLKENGIQFSILIQMSGNKFIYSHLKLQQKLESSLKMFGLCLCHRTKNLLALADFVHFHNPKKCVQWFHFPFGKNSKGSKDMYTILNKNSSVPTAQRKWNTVFDINSNEWKKNYILPFKATACTKLHWFQFRINHVFVTEPRIYLP
jgi:hypothetical protein